ncbi:MAG: hypothetical protein JW807_02575 [Spirochaetes bacterium]|nr:hypothetical protein [Spirochaetota bacterium]
MKLPMFITCASVILLALAYTIVPALSLDQILKLYICQTERELDNITAWEYDNPVKYRQATRNGTLTPLDAARQRAGSLISNETIYCDSENQFIINEENTAASNTKRLDNRELEHYCPRTLKKYGHPCK